MNQTAGRIIGNMADVFTLLLFTSPGPTFVEIIKKKTVERYSAIPYIVTLFNCIFTISYGHPNLFDLTVNAGGIVFEILYLIIFILNTNRDGLIKIAWYSGVEILFGIIAVVVVATAQTAAKRSHIAGIFLIIYSVKMYASPLISVMKLVIQTESVKYMPFWLSLLTFLNGVFWTAYAFLPFDINLVISSGLGALFGMAQLILYGIYYFKATPNDEPQAEMNHSYGQDEP